MALLEVGDVIKTTVTHGITPQGFQFDSPRNLFVRLLNQQSVGYAQKLVDCGRWEKHEGETDSEIHDTVTEKSPAASTTESTQ